MKRSLVLLGALAAIAAQAQVSSSSLTLKSSTPSPWYFQANLPSTSPGSGTSTATGFYNPGTGSNFSGLDIYREGWFWMRSTGTNATESREYQLWQQWSSSLISANQARMTYRQNAGSLVRALEIDMVFTLTGASATQSTLQIDWTVKNLHTAALTTNFFAFMDLNGPQTTLGNANDTGSYQNGSFKFVGQSKPAEFAAFTAYGLQPTAYEMNVANALKTKLTDNMSSTLANAVVDAGPGKDLAAAFQYTLALNPNEVKGGRMVVGYNAVPEPATLLALGTALAGLAARRRRRA